MNYYKEYVTIGLQEIPGEISLLIPLTGCSHKCKNCHSSEYQNPENGTIFTQDILLSILNNYHNKPVSCICFFEGSDKQQILDSFRIIKEFDATLKTAVYSGSIKEQCEDYFNSPYLDYCKCGSYVEKLGGLQERTTNQRLYLITENKELKNITNKFWSKTEND